MAASYGSLSKGKIIQITAESGGLVYNTVNTYADLPAASSKSNQYYAVLTTTGVLFTRKEKGLYRSDGSTWTWMSEIQIVFKDAETTFYDDNDDTKRTQLELTNISPNQTRILTVQDKDITIAGLDDLATGLATKEDSLPDGTTTTVLHGNPSGPPSYSAVVEADISLSDNSTNNVSTTKHGFAPKLSGVSTQYFDGDGNYTTPAGISAAYKSQSFTNETTVVVNHNFGAYPLVQIIDETGAQLIPVSVTHTSVNSFTVVFNPATSGNILASLGAPQLNNVDTITGDYTTEEEDHYLIVTSADAVISLISAVGLAGYELVIKNASAGDITVECSGTGETIDSDSFLILASLNSITVISDGTGYHII